LKIIDNGGLSPFKMNNPIAAITAKDMVYIFFLKIRDENPMMGIIKSKYNIHDGIIPF
jgi:hypothetical protein